MKVLRAAINQKTHDWISINLEPRMKDNKAGKIQTNKPTKAKIIVWERKNNKTAETFTKFKTLMICYQLPTPNNKQITCT